MRGRSIRPADQTEPGPRAGVALRGFGRVNVGRSLEGVPSAEAFAHEGGSVVEVLGDALGFLIEIYRGYVLGHRPGNTPSKNAAVSVFNK